MHVLATIITIAIFIVAFVLLRIRWPRLEPRTQKACLSVALALLFFSTLSMATRWSTFSTTLDSLIEWSRDLSYIFLVILFTLLRPRWLTIPSAIVLILPVFAASLLLPLGDLFNPSPSIVTDLGNNFELVKTPFLFPDHASGVDLAVFYRPAWMPLLRRHLKGNRFFNSQCDANHSFAIIKTDPHPGTIILECPAFPAQSEEGGRIVTFPLH